MPPMDNKYAGGPVIQTIKRRKKMKVAVLVGSLRRESFSRKTAKALIALAPESLKLEIIEIGDIPIYNQDGDDDGKPPIVWTTFRERIKEYDGIQRTGERSI